MSTATQSICMLWSNDRLQCYGANSHGQLGNADNVASPETLRTVVLARGGEALSGVRRLSEGSMAEHYCAEKTDGTVWCWGRNHMGQLGLGHRNPTWVPTQVGGPLATTP